MQKYLNVKEVADLLRCSKNKIYLLTKNGKIPYKRFGNSILFDFQEIEQSLNTNGKKQNNNWKLNNPKNS